MRTLAFLACLVTFSSSAVALDLVKDGKPAATILLPAQPSPSERSAAAVLVKYLAAATGVKLAVVSEPAQPEGNIVSVGRTERAKAAGVGDEGLVYDGYRLAVKGKVLYVLGRDLPFDPQKTPGWGGTRGTYRAAFGLLDKLGFRWILPGDKGVYWPESLQKGVSMPDDLATVHTPPLMYSMSRFDRWGDWSWANGFRLPIRLYTQGGHTWQPFVPASLWETHPEYFRMDNNAQRVKPAGSNHFLCVSHPDVRKLLAEAIRAKFDQGYDLVQLGQSDGFMPCHCPACKALGEGYETEQVHVAHARVMEMVHQTHPGKQVQMMIYGPTKTPSRLVKQYAPNCVFELCSADEDFIRRWAPLAPGGATEYVYFFGTWQQRGLLPKQTAASIVAELAKLHRLGVRAIYWCGGGENWGGEGPAYYAAARCMNDPTMEPREVLSEYCHYVFGKAGPIMVNYYNLIGSRIGRDDGRLLPNEVMVKEYPPAVLEQAAVLLSQAKTMVADDQRATNWLRLVEYSFRQIRCSAETVHLYHAYEINRTPDNLRQVAVPVAELGRLADEIAALDRTAPDFVRDYFPKYSSWKDGVRTNENKYGSSFKWGFEAILAGKMLPGRDRRVGVIRRLAQAPAIDGRLDDPAWKDVAPESLYEIGLGPLDVQTRLWMGFDDRALYFAFECQEPLIDQMTVRECPRDGPVWRTESVELFFDPDAQGVKRMHFMATPSATGIYDARFGYLDDPLHPLVLRGAEDTSWNPAWRHAFAIDRQRKVWTVEIEIPFESLGVRAPADGSRWRVNFGRERCRGSWGTGKSDKRIPVQMYLWSPNLQKASALDQTAFGDLYFNRKP